MEKAIKELSQLIRSRFPLIYVVTHEEQRAVDIISELCVKLGRRVIDWTVTDGFITQVNSSNPVSAPTTPQDPDSMEPFAALGKIVTEIRDEIRRDKIENKVVYVLKDFHPFLENVAVCRRLKDIVKDIVFTLRNVIIVSPVLALPPELEKEAVIVDFPLPDEKEIQDLLGEYETTAKDVYKMDVKLSDDDRRTFVKAAKGLTLTQLHNCFSKIITRDKVFDIDDIEPVMAEKIQSVRKTNILELLTTNESFANIGGLEYLKKWFMERKDIYSERAEQYKLPNSKGVLLLGVPGCGKSLIAKSLGSLWGLPVLRLDVGKIFQGIVGSSEENMRQVIKLTEAMSPCILFIDELDKGFSGTQSSGFCDAGTTSRVFGTFLNWLQDKQKPVFVVATANDISQLQNAHAEFFRHGRWDGMFFIDLPNEVERKEIWNIHIKLKGRSVKDYDMERLVEHTDGYTGAEIEQAVNDAMYKGFSEKREFSQDDLEEAIFEMTPMSKMGNRVQEIRDRAKNVAKPATKELPKKKKVMIKGKGKGKGSFELTTQPLI